mgnify:CR=1 FL=1
MGFYHVCASCGMYEWHEEGESTNFKFIVDDYKGTYT